MLYGGQLVSTDIHLSANPMSPHLEDLTVYSFSLGGTLGSEEEHQIYQGTQKEIEVRILKQLIDWATEKRYMLLMDFKLPYRGIRSKTAKNILGILDIPHGYEPVENRVCLYHPNLNIEEYQAESQDSLCSSDSGMSDPPLPSDYESGEDD